MFNLFSIACKINLGLVKTNGNPGGRGVFGLGNPGGRGGQKTLPSVGGGGGGVDFFWNNPLYVKCTQVDININQSISRSISQSINQSINQQTDQSSNESINQSII